MIDFTYQTGDSFLHRVNPAIKIATLVLCSIIILLTSNISLVILSIVLITASLSLSKISIGKVFRPIKGLYPFFITIFLMNALFYSADDHIYQYGIICISKSGIIQGANIVLRTFMITFLSSIFIRVTTSIEIMKGIETLMHPLTVFGFPVRDLSLVFCIVLQFIPIFFNDITRIRKAQIARGADFTKGSLTDRIKTIIPLIIPAFISAFRRADDLSLAIEARGFQSEQIRNKS